MGRAAVGSLSSTMTSSGGLSEFSGIEGAEDVKLSEFQPILGRYVRKLENSGAQPDRNGLE
jgi:hypothetical protein